MSETPLVRYADLLQRLPGLHDGLRAAKDVGDLLVRGTQLARIECGFGRGVMVGVREGLLTADAMGVPHDPESDSLRRRILAEPPELRSRTIEAELVRRPTSGVAPSAALPSVLAERFGLEDPAFGVVAPEGSTVGMIVLDRPRQPVDVADRQVVTLMGRMLAVVLEHVVMRARVQELNAELRFLTVSAQALATEAFNGPITLPVHGRHLPAFRAVDGTAAAAAANMRDELTDREFEIAALMAEGRSNREIGEQLYLSPETVKDNVGRIVRKLGAANRVDAAIRFVGLGVKPPAGHP